MNTKTGQGRADARSGAILGMVLILVLALSMIGMGLLWLGSTNSVEVSRHVNMNKAFWAAEAGLQHAKAEMRAHPVSYQSQVTRNISNEWYYDARISTSDYLHFSVVSTGIVQGATRVVASVVTVVPGGWPDAFYYTLFGGGGTMAVGKDATIVTGSVYQIGDVSFQKNPTITNGYVYATGNVDGFTKTPPPDPAPTMPEFDTSSYSNIIASAAGSSNAVVPANLGGVTNFVNGDATITSLGGSGTLVVSGNVDLNLNAGQQLASGVSIIAGGQVTFSKNTQTGSNSFIYADAGFYFGKSCNLIQSCVLVSPGSLNTDGSSAKDFTFTGIIYCGGTITMDKNATITGAIVAGDGFQIKKTLVATWVDPSQLIGTQPPTGMETEVNVNDVSWQQLQ